MRRKTICIIATLAVLMALPGDIFADSRIGEEINWYVISSGGTSGSSATFDLEGTIGQAVIGEGSSTTFDLRHGFWQDFAVAEPVPLIKIEETSNTLLGTVEYVSITTEHAAWEFSSFTFLLSYDPAALTLLEVTPGQLLEDCSWEYFTWSNPLSGPGNLRIETIADLARGSFSASCYGPPDTDPHELLEMSFQVTDEIGLSGFSPISFVWDSCHHNSFGPVDTVTQYTAYVDRRVYNYDGSLIWDEEDDDNYPEDARMPWVGAPDYCLAVHPDSAEPHRMIDFQLGGVDIIPVNPLPPGMSMHNVDGYRPSDGSPMGTEWWELGYHITDSIAVDAWIDNGDGILSFCDTIELVNYATGDTVRNHVELVTATIRVYSFASSSQWYLELLNENPLVDPIYAPEGTYWYRVHPSYGPVYTVHNWFDNGNGYLDSCDFIVLEYGSYSDTAHVQAYATDMVVKLGCCAGVRGDVDLEGNCTPEEQDTDISDLTNMIDHMFISYTPVCCPEEGDIAPLIDGDPPDGAIDISDLTAIIDHMFITYPPMPPCDW